MIRFDECIYVKPSPKVWIEKENSFCILFGRKVYRYICLDGSQQNLSRCSGKYTMFYGWVMGGHPDRIRKAREAIKFPKNSLGLGL